MLEGAFSAYKISQILRSFSFFIPFIVRLEVKWNNPLIKWSGKYGTYFLSATSRWLFWSRQYWSGLVPSQTSGTSYHYVLYKPVGWRAGRQPWACQLEPSLGSGGYLILLATPGTQASAYWIHTVSKVVNFEIEHLSQIEEREIT